MATVLIVDDSLTIRADLRRAFSTAGFRCLLAEDAVSARAALSAERVDLMLLDVMLPDEGGFELLKEIRGSPRTERLPVIVLTGETGIAERIGGLQRGADEYVGKPYDAAYLVARARQLTDAAESSRDAKPLILLIDDSATYRHVFNRLLEQGGYAVATADSGEEGLRLASARRPALVMVDGQLPGMDGPSVIRRLRLDAALRTTPCILLTASEEKEAELKAFEAGADAFIRKDEANEAVLARVASLLRGFETRQMVNQAASLMGPKRILAVDDSPTYLHQLSSALRGEGYDLVLASSGEEALALLSVQPVDCVLMDLHLPGIDGHEACRRIKAAAVLRDTPVIMLTAEEGSAAMIESLGTGADDYIPKSGDMQVLKARVRSQLRRKQTEDEGRSMREALLRKEIEAREASAAREIAAARAETITVLERKNKELETFTYAVSHDLRNPLRSIKGFNDMLTEDYADRLDEHGRELLQLVGSASRRMEELINDLLRLSRIDQVELTRERVSLSEIVRLVSADLARAHADRSVEVAIQDDVWVDADAGLMRIVLENLLGNAWKFTAKAARARIEFGCSGDECFVRDNGAGFNMKSAHRLFTPFQRLHRQDDFAGTGIGLATVNRIIDRHGGRARAEGAVGQGATFFFTVPAR